MRNLKLLFCLVLLSPFSSSVASDIKLSPKTVDKIIVQKAGRTLKLYCGDKIVKTYRIALGKNPVGHKEKQGDYKTPEGVYKISGKNPGSQFHKSLRVSYPNQQDLICAKKSCVNPGSDIMVHGLDKKSAWIGKAHRARDWTHGCIAVSNEEMDEIYDLVKVGAIIDIRA